MDMDKDMDKVMDMDMDRDRHRDMDKDRHRDGIWTEYLLLLERWGSDTVAVAVAVAFAAVAAVAAARFLLVQFVSATDRERRCCRQSDIVQCCGYCAANGPVRLPVVACCY